ncbi:MAG: dihydrodipicolinate synthase family protein [Acidobacteria bacterium]|nr:dihydrodipicolinate synthase family protein [Acidobacteriota bacterium]
MPISHPLAGITVPLVTPLTSALTLEVPSLHRLCNHVIEGGVNAIFVLGTTGEGPALPAALRRDVVRGTCESAAGRVPVLVGITDSSMAEILSLSEASAAAGASALVYAGPPYFPVSQSELAGLVAGLVEQLPLPLFLYNMPSHTHVTFEPDTVRQLSTIPQIAGLKDSSANLMYFQKVQRAIAARPGFGLLMGPEELLGAAVLSGATGGVNGGSNLYPRLYVALFQAADRGDWNEVKRLQQIVHLLSAGIYSAGTYSSSYLKGLKCALSIAGLCGPAMAVPYVPWSDSESARIAAAMKLLEEQAPDLCLRPST